MRKKYLLASAMLSLSLLGLPGQAQILIGQTAGFTGPVAAGVKETTDGARLYLDAVNAKGGVNGQKIELLSLDDKFDPKLAADNARVLIEERQVTAMFLTRGTPHTEAVVPLLDKHGVPLVAPSTGAMTLHQPVRKHIFNVRATYQREAERAMQHVATIGMVRIAVVYFDDAFGEDGLAGAQKGLAAAKLTPVLLAKINRDKPDFSTIAPQIVKADAQAVLIISSAAGVYEGVKALRAAGSNCQIVTLSNNASAGFIKGLGDNARGVIVSQVFPSSLNYALVKEALDLARARNQAEVSPAMLEGFAAAKVLTEALRRAGDKPTRAKVQAALEGLNKFDIGGLEVNFSTKDHTGLDFADLSIITSDGKFRR
jgi:ABC-type branched-subunit amino acid transport system substrate-binding protein